MTALAAYPEFPVEDDWDATLAEWLAGLLFAPLSEGAVISYRDGLGASLLEALTLQPGCNAGALQMQAALAGHQTARVLTRVLGTAFMRLFEGVGGPRTASPFESAHAGPAGRLFQQPERAMDELLSRTGLVLASGPSEPADHISIELAVLAHLIRGRADLDDAATLLDRHLLAWAPGFGQAVRAADNTGFYAGATSLLVGFLAAQRAAICTGATAPGAPDRPWLPQHGIGVA